MDGHVQSGRRHRENDETMARLRSTSPLPRDLLYRSHSSVSSLLETADATCDHATPLFGAVVAAEEGLDALLARLVEGRRKARGFGVSGRSPYLVLVPVSSNVTSPLAGGAAKIFLWQGDGSRLIYVLGLKDDFDYLFDALRTYLATDISSVYLLTSDFLKTFDRIALTHERLQVRVTGYTASVLSDEGKSLKTRREWFTIPKEPVDFFGGLEDEKQWIRSLSFLAKAPKDEDSIALLTTRGRVRRDMTFACEGDFATFFSIFVTAFHDRAAKGRELFLNRGVSDSPTRSARPLQITYGSPVFQDKDQNRRLIEVLHKLPDAALSVFHGNPYLHASLVDYATGSSYVLWITDNAAIKIVPELRATPGSLERICNHITEHFAEGEIGEIVES